MVGKKKAAGECGGAGREVWASILALVDTARQSHHAAFEALDLSPAQGFLLRRLQPDQPTPMTEIAGALACDASNVTGLVDKLESRGLVERRADPNDRRVKMIAMTKTGLKLRAKLVELFDAPPACVEVLTPEEHEQLSELLNKVVAATRSPPEK